MTESILGNKDNDPDIFIEILNQLEGKDIHQWRDNLNNAGDRKVDKKTPLSKPFKKTIK